MTTIATPTTRETINNLLEEILKHSYTKQDFDHIRMYAREASDALKLEDELHPQPRIDGEVAALKRDWRNDPTWDIETTEGFEVHRDELLIYRLETERTNAQRELAEIRSGVAAMAKLLTPYLPRPICHLEPGE